MGHYATVYSICVHKRNRPKERLPLGAISEQRPYLGDFFSEVFDPNTFEVVSSNAERTVGCEYRQFGGANNDDLQVIFTPGERGVDASILDPEGNPDYKQTPDHTQVLRSGSLFRLPREEEFGWWACHVNNGRSFKTLVHNRLTERFKQTLPEDLMLKIAPCVNSAALEEAVKKDRLLSASLSKYERSPDVAEGGEWVRNDTALKLRLHIIPERGKRLDPRLALAAMKSKSLGNIVEFGGINYDTAQFEVELEGGQHRSFKIEAPDSGHAFSALIEPALDGKRVPVDSSLFDELGKVLAELG
ncbi:MAG TPA: hypothetical protein VHF50_02225 [Solirubrobacterales bacterium]|nr:hypothetical protein [Solirubrobacterales bacterium]